MGAQTFWVRLEHFWLPRCLLGCKLGEIKVKVLVCSALGLRPTRTAGYELRGVIGRRGEVRGSSGSLPTQNNRRILDVLSQLVKNFPQRGLVSAENIKLYKHAQKCANHAAHKICARPTAPSGWRLGHIFCALFVYVLHMSSQFCKNQQPDGSHVCSIEVYSNYLGDCR